eukprot:GFUD01038321.1.p1 GENE.GFUD01038321.1~~GFUD01038321.1.p1  ORF type:complete len:542 (+),score=134.82 GFUD01038321.1:26-1627(+)
MWLEIFLIFVTFFVLLYRYVTKSFGKWKSLGIPYTKPSFPMGTYNFLSGRHLDDMSAEDHKKYLDQGYFGTFLLGKPVLAINDANFLKHIEVKDFDHFVDRFGDASNKKLFSGGDTDKIWGQQLTGINGDDWKELRSAFTPIFTSGKMKGMLKFIKHIAVDLNKEMEEKAKQGEEFELKDVFGKFSLDALASSAFGVNAESFTNKDSKFVRYAATIFKHSKLDIAIIVAKFIPGVPQLLDTLKLNTFKAKETKYFRDIILQTIKNRKQTNERKNDLVDLMLDCIKEDTAGNDEDEEESDQYEKDMKLNHTRKGKHNLDEISIVATAMVLLVAGYDTTGMTLSFLSYEMSKNPEAQKKLQEEIDHAYEEAGGEFPDYNAIQNLPYLDMVIHETLRIHSPVGFNTRNATKDYVLQGTDIVIKKDDMVSWNAKSLHFDPKYWTNPTEFYPEHFSKEEKANRNPYAYQAFGQGPRACIGMRFALLETKVAVLSVLRNFSFKEGSKTQEPLVLDGDNQLGWVKGGLWARVEPREEGVH